MRVVLDTNILISAVFFGGLPRAVLDAWADGEFELLLSPSIFDEYVRTCERLAESHPGLEYQSILATIVGRGTLVPDTAYDSPITADPDDDKFLLCAQGRGCVVTGDQHLLDASGWEGVQVLKPRDFLTQLRDESPGPP